MKKVWYYLLYNILTHYHKNYNTYVRLMIYNRERYGKGSAAATNFHERLLLMKIIICPLPPGVAWWGKGRSGRIEWDILFFAMSLSLTFPLFGGIILFFFFLSFVLSWCEKSCGESIKQIKRKRCGKGKHWEGKMAEI